jgi:hypothetical protein
LVREYNLCSVASQLPQRKRAVLPRVCVNS